MPMKELSPEQQWEIQKRKLRELFPELNIEDFQYDYGEKEVMMMELQQKLGKTREELHALLLPES